MYQKYKLSGQPQCLEDQLRLAGSQRKQKDDHSGEKHAYRAFCQESEGQEKVETVK